MNKRTVTALVVCLIVIIGVTYGVKHSADLWPNFWGNFIPNLWANVIGVTVAAVIGVPVGFAVNHYILSLSETRQHQRQIDQVKALVEQVRRELSLHSTTLQRLSQTFYSGAAGRTATPPGSDVIAGLILQDLFGKQFISNRSVLDIGESLLLFQISNYYARVGDLNRLLNWRIQDIQHPEVWDRPIEGIVSIVLLARTQVDYEIEQAIQRFSGVRN